MATSYEKRLRIPLSGDDKTRFETSTGLHVATGYTRVVIGGRGPYVEFLPGQLIWDSLQIPDEEKYRTEHPWKDKVFYVEWRTKDQSNVKVYEQSRTVDYADYKVGFFYISPFDLFVEGEPVITKLEKKKSREYEIGCYYAPSAHFIRTVIGVLCRLDGKNSQCFPNLWMRM